jgi:hypothetical protein
LAEDDALRVNVLRSLETALEILAHLEASLARAGFAAGIEAYQAMTHVLLGQRLWSAGRGDPELNSRFDAVAARADAVLEMLAPYTEVMLKLRALQVIEGAVAAPQACTATQPEELVLAALRERPLGDSLTNLRTRTGLGTRELKTILAALAEKGEVAARMAGGRTLYSLLGRS